MSIDLLERVDLLDITIFVTISFVLCVIFYFIKKVINWEKEITKFTENNHLSRKPLYKIKKKYYDF